MNPDVQALSARVDTLLERVEPRADAQELVRTLVTLYGEALSRIVETIAGAPEGERILETLCGDPFVASLLIVHDLHPVPLDERIERALDGIRPYLRSHGGEVRFVRAAGGVAEVRLSGSCDGCPSSSSTMTLAVERAVFEAAPEILEVRANGTETARDLPHVSIWTAVDTSALLPHAFARTAVDGAELLLIRADEQLYAYADRCPACLRSLEEPSLEWPFMRCSGCGEMFDAVHAGQSTSSQRHLDPLPLKVDGKSVRVSIPVTA